MVTVNQLSNAQIDYGLYTTDSKRKMFGYVNRE